LRKWGRGFSHVSGALKKGEAQTVPEWKLYGEGREEKRRPGRREKRWGNG